HRGGDPTNLISRDIEVISSQYLPKPFVRFFANAESSKVNSLFTTKQVRTQQSQNLAEIGHDERDPEIFFVPVFCYPVVPVRPDFFIFVAKKKVINPISI